MNRLLQMGRKRQAVSHVVRYDRLRRGKYYADFRRDERLMPEVYQCIIQRDGSSEILWWSQFRSLDSAVRAAEKQLQHLSTGEQRAA